MINTASVPIIDIGPYLCANATASEQAKVIDDVRNACCEYGFLQVEGHGVPADVQKRMLDACKILFDLPQGQKDALSLKKSPARRGYETIGEQVLDAEALPDMKEGFYVGREVSPDDISFMKGPNQWPELPSEVFHAPVTGYYKHVVRLGKALLEILAMGLGHDVSILETFTKEPVVNLKLLHYPPHTSTDKNQFGAGAHTDFGSITILLQQPGMHGLQVYHQKSREWLAVPALEDVLVVNMGDLIHKWTSGKYHSTLHRVINISGGDRYSVPCFYQGDLSATNPFNSDDSSPETVEQHIRKKFDTSYGLPSK